MAVFHPLKYPLQAASALKPSSGCNHTHLYMHVFYPNSVSSAAESRFFEPPSETKIGSREVDAFEKPGGRGRERNCCVRLREG